MKRFLILSFFLILLVFQTNAQQHTTDKPEAPGKISGKIVDSAAGTPVEYATISLLIQESGKVVNGTTTDDKGVFNLTGIENGTYKMQIYFIGYRLKEQDNIVISSTNLDVHLTEIKLANKLATLKEVTVTAEKSIIENKIDKMVYNVDKDVTSQTGAASDVLKKIPQVSVDVDGNVELQGNSNIRFLINGKPSAIFGNSISDVLQSIPSSQIQSIEVITSPGAKYDAEGTGGIINIILKKSTAQGINGNISLSGGTRLENGSFNLTIHRGHFSVNTFLSGNALIPSTTNNNTDRLSQDNPASLQSSELTQNGTSKFSRNGYQAGLGFDWEISPKDNLSASFNLNYFEYNNLGANNRTTTEKDSAGNISSIINDQANTESHSHFQSLDWSLNYKRTFKREDQELDISYIASSDNNYSYYKQTQQFVSPDLIYSGSTGTNPGTNKETALSLDYTQPVTKKISFETGAKAVFSPVNSTSQVYLLDPYTNDYVYNSDQSPALRYNTNVYAAYLSGTFKFFNWLDFKPGFRYEYTEPSAYFSNAGDITIKPYGTYVPSAVIAHTYKNGQTLKLSYSHRIQRPEYRDLNPFVNASDPKNLTTGNTALRPEIGDKIELSYNKTFEKGTSINVTLFYRGNKDDIQSFSRYYSSYAVGDSTYSNVTVSTRENIGREDNYGLNLFGSVPVTSKINLRTNISAFQRYIINGAIGGKNIQGFNYRINLNATYEITSTLVVEFFGNFNSLRVNAQGTMPSFTTYNFAFRKQFFNKKASLAITAANPFNKYIDQKTQLTGDNFTLITDRQLPYRSFGINFTYKFGKLEFKKDREPDDANMNNPPQ